MVQVSRRRAVASIVTVSDGFYTGMSGLFRVYAGFTRPTGPGPQCKAVGPPESLVPTCFWMSPDLSAQTLTPEPGRLVTSTMRMLTPWQGRIWKKLPKNPNRP